MAKLIINGIDCSGTSNNATSIKYNDEKYNLGTTNVQDTIDNVVGNVNEVVDSVEALESSVSTMTSELTEFSTDIDTVNTSITAINDRLGNLNYIYLTDSEHTGNHIEYIKSIWGTLEANAVYIAKVVSASTRICLVQKFSDLYGTIMMIGYDMWSTTTIRCVNGEWKDEYNPYQADRQYIHYATDTKEEALAKLDNPTTMTNINTTANSCYNLLFADSVGDSPLGGGVTEILGYTYTSGLYGFQMALKYSERPKYRNNVNGKWSDWIQVANHADVTTLKQNQGLPKYRWSCVVKCATWQRLCHVSYGGGLTGATYMINIRGTRNGVVYSDTFMVTAHHKKWGTIVKINGHGYSGIDYDVRIVVDSSGNSYFEIYDDIRSATSDTEQTITCSLIPITTGTVTTYTTGTDGTTLPDEFAVAKTMNVNTSSFQCEELDEINTRTIDGFSFNGATDINHYAICDTEGSTGAKVATIQSGTFTLTIGSSIYVKFTNTNTAGSPTLNVANTGHIAIHYDGSTIVDGGENRYIKAGGIYHFIYDGTNWILDGGVNTNLVTTGQVTSSTDYPLLMTPIYGASLGASSTTACVDYHPNFTLNPSTGVMKLGGKEVMTNKKVVVSASSTVSLISFTSYPLYMNRLYLICAENPQLLENTYIWVRANQMYNFNFQLIGEISGTTSSVTSSGLTLSVDTSTTFTLSYSNTSATESYIKIIDFSSYQQYGNLLV